MPLVGRNIAANFLAKAWMFGMSFVFVPVYVRVLGVEAYGLIGLFITIQSIAILLDGGLSTTLNRELARRCALPELASSMARLTRTLETIYWLAAGSIFLIVVLISPYIAEDWLNSTHLDRELLYQASILLGLSLALQWPLSFYSGGLLGLEKQVSLAVLNIVGSTLRNGGAAVILLFVSPTIEGLVKWQAAVGFLHTLCAMGLLWRSLPAGQAQAKFEFQFLRDLKGFSGGVALTSILAVVLTQTDKVVLSRMLSLSDFGCYMLAGLVSGGISYLGQPISAAFFPRLSQATARGEAAELKRLYHTASQSVAVAIAAPAALLIFFPEAIVLLWTHDYAVAEHVALILPWLSVGAMLNTLMQIPYCLQLAHSWTGLAIKTNAVAALVLVPLIIALAWKFGAVGGAAAWVALNLGYVLIGLRIMNRRLLTGELGRWYWQDVSLPIGGSFLAMALVKWLIFPGWPAGWEPVLLVLAFGLSLWFSILAADHVRRVALDRARGVLVRFGALWRTQ